MGRREEWVDEFVVATVCERLSKPDALGIFQTDDSEMDQARKKVAELRARLDGAADAYASGADRHRAADEDHRAGPTRPRCGRAALPGPRSGIPTVVHDLIDADDPCGLDGLTVSQQRAILESLGIEGDRQTCTWWPRVQAGECID